MSDEQHRLTVVSERLYEALQRHCNTPEEVCAGRVLRIHRDWLNGGFKQAFNNVTAIGLSPATFAGAYAEIGLPTVAALIADAAATWSDGKLLDARADLLDDRYERLTYTASSGNADAIELAVASYVQRNRAAFSEAFAHAVR